MDNTIPHIELTFQRRPADEMMQRAREMHQFMEKRRSVRQFSDEPVTLELVEQLVRTASTAPSGAHKQPWTFCLVGDPVLKKRIREAAEVEERLNYGGRMGEEWLQDLEPFGTTWQKPYLEVAPWLVVVFKKIYEEDADGRHKNYYVSESVGLATGFFLAAAHHAGLAALVHTPSPMDFLGKILERPANERPFLLIPIGFPAPGATVPDLRRKPLEAVRTTYLEG